MAAASGIAKIISNLPEANHYFAVAEGLTHAIGNNTISGGWTLASADTVLWGGANPVIQNTSGATRTANVISVFTGTQALASDLLCHISHTGVTLNDQESVEYTSIEISHATDDIT